MELGSNLAEFIRGIIQPLYLVGIGAAALYFLVQRSLAKLLAFALVAVLVGSFIFVPSAWQGVAESFAGLLQ